MEKMYEKLENYLADRKNMCLCWAEEKKWEEYSHTRTEMMGALDFCVEIGAITVEEWTELIDTYM